jgi:hypothetical protein
VCVARSKSLLAKCTRLALARPRARVYIYVCVEVWNTFSCTKSNMKTISPKVAKRFFNNTAGGFFLFLLSCVYYVVEIAAARTLFSPSRVIFISMPCAAVSFLLAELLFEELQQRASIICLLIIAQGAVCTYYFSYTHAAVVENAHKHSHSQYQWTRFCFYHFFISLL